MRMSHEETGLVGLQSTPEYSAKNGSTRAREKIQETRKRNLQKDGEERAPGTCKKTLSLAPLGTFTPLGTGSSTQKGLASPQGGGCRAKLHVYKKHTFIIKTRLSHK